MSLQQLSPLYRIFARVGRLPVMFLRKFSEKSMREDYDSTRQRLT